MNNPLPSATLFSTAKCLVYVSVCVRQCALLLLLLCGPGEVCVCVSMSLLGLCALLRMIELESPTSKEIITVVVPLSSTPHKSGILFTSVPSLPSKLALQCIPSKSILTLRVFSAAQILSSLSFALCHSFSSSPSD